MDLGRGAAGGHVVRGGGPCMDYGTRAPIVAAPFGSIRRNDDDGGAFFVGLPRMAS